MQAIQVSDDSTWQPRGEGSMTADNTQQLWQRYREEGDLAARDCLVEQNLSLVRKEARRVHQRVSAGVQYDELLSAGALGLLQAVERFDPARGWRLSTIAVPRIRGAMLDHLRQQSGMPRSTLVRARRMAIARASVEGRLGRHARESEIAEELGVGAAQYHAWHQDSVRAVVPLTADVAVSQDGDGHGHDAGPEWLTEAIRRLPANEHTVITLGFYEELPPRDIAKVLGVSQSRVSQLRSRALTRLRNAKPIREAV